LSALRDIAPFGGRHPSRCDGGVRELAIGDFGPRWRLLDFVAQNPSIGTVGPCYANTGVSGQRGKKPREDSKTTQGHHAMWHGVTVPRGTVMPRVVFWHAMVAARGCLDVQILLTARVRL